MIYGKNKNGRAIEFSVWGRYSDDIQIDEAYYLDDSEEEVSDEDIEYLYNNYSNEMYEDYIESKCMEADYYYDSIRDGH